MRVASLVCLLACALAVVRAGSVLAIDGDDRPTMACVNNPHQFQSDTPTCECSTASSADEGSDCQCAASQPCECGGEHRCLCGASSSCECEEQDCYCGTAKECKGERLMFCAENAGVGDKNCQWEYSSSYSSDYYPSGAFCVPNPTSFDTLPDCLRSGNITTACLRQYACKNGTALYIANHPEVVIIPVMALVNLIGFCTIVLCNMPRCLYNTRKDIPLNADRGHDMRNLRESSCPSWFLVMIVPFPFIVTISAALIGGPIYLLIPAGLSLQIMQFIGMNQLVFEPQKNRISHYKYYCCCIPFLYDREALDQLLPIPPQTNVGFSIRNSKLPITIKRKDQGVAITMPINQCSCDCNPNNTRDAQETRIRTFLDQYLGAEAVEAAAAADPMVRLQRSRVEAERRRQEAQTRLAEAKANRDAARANKDDEKVKGRQVKSLFIARRDAKAEPGVDKSGSKSSSKSASESSAEPSTESEDVAPPPYDPNMGEPGTASPPSLKKDGSKPKIFCTHCGKKQHGSAKFCASCGKKIHKPKKGGDD